jgi:hypothetical protein
MLEPKQLLFNVYKKRSMRLRRVKKVRAPDKQPICGLHAASDFN